MTVENDLKWDDKLEEIKNSLLGHFKENGYGVVIPSKKEDGSKEKEIKEITWFILTKEKSKSFQSNGFIVEKKDNLYTCKLKWWAGTEKNKDRWAGVDKKKKEELTDNVQEKAVDSLISVCEKKWNGAEKPKDGNGQRGMNVKIADIPIELAENKEKLTSEFVNPIFSWEKSNMQEFEYIQGELKKGWTESEIENIKQRLVKGIQMKEYIDLLLNNHNIILHGAPGTGKTHLAKEIAQQLIFEKSEDLTLLNTKEEQITDDGKMEEKKALIKQFNDQCGFVQFHQSYDYTDFVEGLRPKEQDGRIVFIRKDGIFKVFCEKALKNLINCHKSLDEINSESFWNQKCDEFLKEYCSDGEKILYTETKKNEFFIDDYDDDTITIAIPKNEKKSSITLKRKDLIDAFKKASHWDTAQSFKESIGKKLHNRSDYYLFAIANKIGSTAGEMDKTYKEPEKRKAYIFIIDEINRGEMSKIFGELFYSIDPGYRVKYEDLKKNLTTLRTQYANLQENANVFDDALGIEEKENFDHFFVSENVYIIGTMNDIDRSVESMDFAMRRRFAFKEITAAQSQESMFGDVDKWEKSTKKKITTQLLDKLKNRMNNLNKAILDEKYHLGQAYQIGGAYFLKFAKYYTDAASEKEAFKKLWENHIAGVVKEYLRGIDDKKETLFGELKNAYYKELDSASTQPVDARDVNNAVAETGAGGEN